MTARPEFTAELLERQSPGLVYAMWRKGSNRPPRR
jgi:hypothetical protein